MKKYFLRLLVIIAAVVIVFSPYLLIIDFVRYAPIVLMIWFLSVAYYLLIRKRVDRRLKEKRDEGEGGDVSRETLP
jgi:membrane protein implicated in regulation of membrane protease activity